MRSSLRALEDVVNERNNQDLKWGEQNHNPLGWIGILTEEVGEAAKEACSYAWEDVAKDLALKRFREEMIQVAAVALAAVECLDRDKWNEKEPS